MERASSRRYNFFLKGGSKSVLLIHGITGTPSEMRHFGKRLHKAGYTVYCNALPRHCGSLDELRKVTWNEIADACIEDFKFLKKESSQVFVAGLSMGAIMGAHLAHIFPSDVSGIVALAPTLFYDGWALPKRKFLMNFIWQIPFLRNRINVREGQPYGLKDESLRESIERFYKNAKTRESYKKTLLFGSPFFPLSNLYQLALFVKVVQKELPEVKVPLLILHAREDDMTSIRNARYVMDHIGSSDKTLVILEDSYHMITIDKEKDKVAEEAVKFLNRL